MPRNTIGALCAAALLAACGGDDTPSPSIQHTFLRAEAELFPAWRAEMHPALRGVTVTQLLRHRGGFKRDLDDDDGAVLLPLATGDAVADRPVAVRHLLRLAPAQAVGTYSYSNAGYMIAGLIAETAGGAPFETLMQREVFTPLGVVASFGFPEDAQDSPVAGHVRQDGAWRRADFPAADRYNMGHVAAAAGGMTIAMTEYAKLLREHLRGLQGTSAFLRKERRCAPVPMNFPAQPRSYPSVSSTEWEGPWTRGNSRQCKRRYGSCWLT